MNRSRFHGVSPYEDEFGFARAVRVGDVIYVAGTAPIAEPDTQPALDAYGQMLRCGEIAGEAIEGLGGSMADVVRTRMFRCRCRRPCTQGDLRQPRTRSDHGRRGCSSRPYVACRDRGRGDRVERSTSSDVAWPHSSVRDEYNRTLLSCRLGIRPTTYPRRKAPRERHEDCCRRIRHARHGHRFA